MVRATLSITLCGGALLLAACAQPTAVFQSGNNEALTGDVAVRSAGDLAVAQGGPAQGKRDPRLQVVALIDGTAMPTGVTVSRDERIFLTFPRWGDKVNHTVMELRNGQLVPFPDPETTSFDPNFPNRFDPRTHLVSVQSVVADNQNRLWVLDPGSINFGPIIEGAPKLWAYDLSTGRRIMAIAFPNDVAMKLSYLNDVRIDSRRGPAGMAYITDSGAGGIVVVDLASGNSWRHLDRNPSVRPTPDLQQTTEGQPFMQRKPTGEQMAPDMRSDGIALSPDGSTLYYTPLASRDVFAIPTQLLADRNAPETALAAAVRKVATKPSGNDGLICDAQGRIYSTDFETNAIARTDPASGRTELLVQDERLLWPDTFSLQGNQLYFTSNQLARQPNYHFGRDQRQPPYVLFRMQIDGQSQLTGGPVLQRGM